MRRLLDFLLRNWPLKLGAIVLATVLYGGVVLSENTRTWPGQVPIDVLNPPPNAAVVDVLGFVTNIRYRAPIDVASQLTNGSFRASVDLSRVDPQPGGPPVEVPVQLLPIDARVQIVDYTPKVVNVRVDEVVTRSFPVTVEHGPVPAGLRVGPAQVDPPSVDIEGASSRVASVRRAVARVAIDASGLNVDQEVEVVPVDENGNRVPGVNVTPARVSVRMAVARDLTTVTLPVTVELSGEPPAGYRIAEVSVAPLAVTVSGDAATVEQMGLVHTLPVDVSGHDADFATDVGLDLPPTVTVNGPSTVAVNVSVEVAQGSRSVEVGVQPTGLEPGKTYDLATGSVLMTLAGPVADLDALSPEDVRASVNVQGLSVGAHDVPVTAEAPKGIAILAISPATVVVEVVEIPSPEPTPGLSPSPAGGTGSTSPAPSTVP